MGAKPELVCPYRESKIVALLSLPIAMQPIIQKHTHLKQVFILSEGFSGSGIPEWLTWMVVAQGLS